MFNAINPPTGDELGIITFLLIALASGVSVILVMSVRNALKKRKNK